MDHVLTSLAWLFVLGLGAQWLAWRLHLPSIFLLLLSGILAGPILHLVDPDRLFGDLFYPIVSMSVALILFEGSMNLKFAELKDGGHAIMGLITIGTALTWILTTVASVWVLSIELRLATLLGAILVVTGPTVILPMLRFIRPVGRVGHILKWEGIAIDTLGALLAVIVYEIIAAETLHQAAQGVIFSVLQTIFLGSLLGVLSASFLVLALKRYWIPDFLQNSFVLAAVLGSFSLAMVFFNESTGFLTVTAMGMVLANQRLVSIKHIVEFKENLRILLLAGLFLLLAARLPINNIGYINSNTFFFVALLIFVIRPLSVFLATYRTKLDWKEKVFLSWMAPRGVVAAAVASIFAIKLDAIGFPQAEGLIVVTFFVIIVTVFIYGLTAAPLAYGLKIASPNPQGVLILGGHYWARELAKVLQTEGFRVVIVDSNSSNARISRAEGLAVHRGSIFSDSVLDMIDLHGIGRLICLTANDEANSLACLHYIDVFSRANVYQLPIFEEKDTKGDLQQIASQARGRILFRKNASYSQLMEWFQKGGVCQVYQLVDQTSLDNLSQRLEAELVPLFVITEKKDLLVISADKGFTPKIGQSVICLILTPTLQ